MCVYPREHWRAWLSILVYGCTEGGGEVLAANFGNTQKSIFFPQSVETIFEFL